MNHIHIHTTGEGRSTALGIIHPPQIIRSDREECLIGSDRSLPPPPSSSTKWPQRCPRASTYSRIPQCAAVCSFVWCFTMFRGVLKVKDFSIFIKGNFWFYKIFWTCRSLEPNSTEDRDFRKTGTWLYKDTSQAESEIRKNTQSSSLQKVRFCGLSYFYLPNHMVYGMILGDFSSGRNSVSRRADVAQSVEQTRSKCWVRFPATDHCFSRGNDASRERNWWPLLKKQNKFPDFQGFLWRESTTAIIIIRPIGIWHPRPALQSIRKTPVWCTESSIPNGCRPRTRLKIHRSRWSVMVRDSNRIPLSDPF